MAFQETLRRSMQGIASDAKKPNIDPAVRLEGDVDLMDLEGYGIFVKNADIMRNPSAAKLYEMALRYEDGSAIVHSGAIATRSGAKTGRSPQDKRIVDEPSSTDDVWWGKVNIKLNEKSFLINRERALDYLNIQPRLYVVDGYAGWDERHRIKIRVITARAYHALFMENMLIRPTAEQLRTFGEPDYTIYNAGAFPANKFTEGMTSTASVSLHFARREMVILGTQYAGEMKKGVFTIMNYLMPKQGILSMHASANEGKDGDVTVFFGLSGTGKTTLSADPRRMLIGDDEHCWTDEGVFNIEGGCYAKCCHLSAEHEPEIYNAIRFGAVLENVVYDEYDRHVDYDNLTVTENTRASYPIEFIPNAKIPCIGGHPTNIVFLTCDAFGVLPPVSKLTPEQAMYHFISGYTAKVAGTEVGVTEPTATFSACFGAPFMVWHPQKYASILAEKIKQYNVDAYLVNTGWINGGYGVGKRISLAYTRAIIDAIHHGDLKDGKVEYKLMPVFNLAIPKSCPGVPDAILTPRNGWPSSDAYDEQLQKVATLFRNNFVNFAEGCSQDVLAAGPSQ